MSHLTTQLWDPLLPGTIDDPYPLYRTLRESFPLYRNEERDLFALSRFDDVAAANADWRTYSSADGIDLDETGLVFAPGRHGNVVETDPPIHGPLRRVLRGYLTPKWVSGLEETMRREVRAAAPGLCEDGAYDVAERLCAPLPLAVICDLLGLDESDRPLVSDSVAKMFYRVPGAGEVPDTAVAAVREIHGLLEGHLRRRVAAPGDDLLSAIAHGQVEERRLTLDEQLGMSVLILAAGIRTARNLLTNVFWHLGTRPDLRRRLAAEPDLAPSAVEELLRFDSPGQFVSRKTTTPIELHGVHVPERSTVVLLYGSANRDDRRYDRPDEIDLDRRVGRHFTFGGGVHSCLGAPLARLEARVVIEELIPRIGEFAVGSDPVRSYKPDERGFERLPIQR
ncbi:MAG: cytochrome [Blastococcus sp.]|jgi:cytochrome P450|nr:cytochrome [Blastococcus sp.]